MDFFGTRLRRSCAPSRCFCLQALAFGLLPRCPNELYSQYNQTYDSEYPREASSPIQFGIDKECIKYGKHYDAGEKDVPYPMSRE
jgi:hypothetical protein